MPLDETIYELRLEKLKQIEALGQPAYRNSYEFTHTVTAIVDECTSKSEEELDTSRVNVRVAGRIMTIRLMGKAGFAHIQQGGQKLQIYVKKDAVGEKGFELYKLLDIGDHIGVSGYLFRTRTGELSVHVDEITFLSKDLLPLPEKWHGLAEVELRYRQRYLDLVMNPEVREVFLKRSKLVQSMRRFLDSNGFIEVETPMMQPMAGGAVARPFVTHHNTLDIDLYLRIAPELYLKRLVVGGFDRVYEINRNFRNEGISTRHNPEFTMLEFYQAYADFRGVMDLTQQLIESAVMNVTGGTKTKWGDDEIDWSSPNWRRMTMREAIIHYWPDAAGAKPEMPEFNDPHALAQSLRKTEYSLQSAHDQAADPLSGEEARSVRRSLSILRTTFAVIRGALEKGENVGKAIADIFEAVVEEHLIQPTIIYEFPAVISPLSKNKPNDPDWVERFEIFAGKMEISNGFSELNDPEEQRRRFQQQLGERERGDQEAHQMDEDYIRALSYGMPPTGGVGVGIDRLAMLLTDSHTIRDVIFFPLMRPERAKAAEADEASASSQ